MSSTTSQEPASLPLLLVRQILDKLGIAADRYSPDATGLHQLYHAWCQKVPFDNIHKRIHLAKGAKGLLPGTDPQKFFHDWLEHGTGGTCWAGSSALHSLFITLGFKARRTLATMVTDHDPSPNHGTVLVDLGEEEFLVDTSIMHNMPLRLQAGATTVIPHPAWKTTATSQADSFHIQWRPLHMPEGCECRLAETEVTQACFNHNNELSKTRSPFNSALTIRINRADSVIGISQGKIIEIDKTGVFHYTEATPQKNADFLASELGMSNKIVAMIPPDEIAP